MKIFVTGGTGFIGSHLLKRLKDKKYDVTILIRDKNLAKSFEDQGFKVIIGNITDLKKFKNQLNKNEVFIHLAAIRSNWGKATDFLKVNSEFNFIEGNSSLKHVIIISSVYVYGVAKKLPISEQTPLRAEDIYGKSKILLEENAKKVLSKAKIPYTILRPAIAYGKGDNELGMMTKMVNLISEKKMHILGDGKNLLHLIYIDDLIDGIVKAIKKGGKNNIYNLASEKPISLEKLISLIKSTLGLKYQVLKLPKPPALFLSYFIEYFYKIGLLILPKYFNKEPFISPIKVSAISNSFVYDISKAKKDLNFKPKIDYPSGIKKLINGK